MPVLRFAVLALCFLSLAAPALGANGGGGGGGGGGGDGGGPKVQVQDKRDEYSYEYEDAHCKFKYKFKYKDGEEEVEEEGDCPPAYALPQFAPPVPYGAAARPEPGYARRDFCDRALAGAVAGAVAGGAVGSQVASGDDRAVAILLGGLIGGVLGHEIGRRIDEADRDCMGRALAYAEPGVEVGWTNPESDLSYDLRAFSPYRERHGVRCRSFEMRVDGGRWRDAEACQRGDGSWQLVSLD